MYNVVKSAIISSLFVASAYGALPQQNHTTLTYQEKYAELKLPISATSRNEPLAKTYYQVFADNDVFKAKGNLETQVSESIHVNVGATVQVQNGEPQIIPKAAITYKISERAGAKISYNEKSASQYNSRMLRVMASVMF